MNNYYLNNQQPLIKDIYLIYETEQMEFVTSRLDDFSYEKTVPNSGKYNLNSSSPFLNTQYGTNDVTSFKLKFYNEEDANQLIHFMEWDLRNGELIKYVKRDFQVWDNVGKKYFLLYGCIISDIEVEWEDVKKTITMHYDHSELSVGDNRYISDMVKAYNRDKKLKQLGIN